LDRIELPKEIIELPLEETNVHCFKRGTDEKGFVSRLDEIFDMADELNISISDVLVKISQRTT
jgi:hypothetical protein